MTTIPSPRRWHPKSWKGAGGVTTANQALAVEGFASSFGEILFAGGLDYPSVETI